MPKRVYISFLVTLLLLPWSEAFAEEEQEGMVDTSVLVVNAVVNIDQDNRILTLRNENPEISTFTLGPEVQNFNEIKQG